MSVFDKMTDKDKDKDKEIDTAQAKLNKLCLENKIKPFSLKHYSHRSKKWQALVMRMCGIDTPNPSSGRNPDKNLTNAAGQTYLLIDLFGDKPKDTYKKIIEEYDLKPNKYGYIEKSDLVETLRKARSRYKKNIESASIPQTYTENPDTKDIVDELEAMMK